MRNIDHALVLSTFNGRLTGVWLSWKQMGSSEPLCDVSQFHIRFIACQAPPLCPTWSKMTQAKVRDGFRHFKIDTKVALVVRH